MLHLILGKAGTGKSERLLQDIKQDACEKKHSILLVPEQFSFTAEKRLFEQLGAAGMLYVEVLSFTRLADRIFRQYGGLAGNFIDDMDRTILMDLTMHELTGSLQVFKKMASHLEFQQSLISLVRRFKMENILPLQLEEIVHSLQEGALKEKMQEFSLIYSVYDGYIQKSYLDADDNLTKAASLLEEHAFFKDFHLYIDGFHDFSASEFSIIRYILRDSPKVMAAFSCDGFVDHENGMGLFSNVKRTVNRMIQAAKQSEVPVKVPEILEKPYRFHTDGLQALQAHLFESRPSHTKKKTNAKGVRLICTDNPAAQVKQTAVDICQLVYENGYRFSDIAVIVRTMENTELFETIFSKYNISYFLDKRADITAKPLIRLVLSALQCIKNHYDTDDLFRFIKSSLYHATLEEIAELENYCYIWDIKGRMWLREFPFSPSGFDTPSEDDPARLEKLNLLRERIIAPLQHLQEDAADCDGVGFAKSVYTFLEEIQVKQAIQEQMKKANQKGNAALEKEYAEIWELLMHLLDKFATALKGVRLPFKRFVELFESLVLQSDYGRIPQSADQVIIGEADKVRLYEKRAVFILGANEDIFPQNEKRTGMFSERDCKVLRENGLLLFESQEEEMSREWLYAYNALMSATDRLSISFTKTDEKGQICYPSVIVKEVQRILKNVQIEEPKGDFSEITNEKTAFEWFASHIRSDDVRTVSLYNYLKMSGFASQTEKLLGVMDRKPFQIEDKQLATKLFGKRLFLSPSRVEKYHSCQFAYFCQNGLKAKSRRKADFSPIEVGSLIHYALQVILSKYGAQGLIKADAAALKKETAAVLSEYLEDVLGEVEKQSARIKYLFTRLQGTVEKLLLHLAKEFSQSAFEPIAFEMPISLQSKVKSIQLQTPDGGSIAVEGIVDRVDVMKRGQKKYVRVIDYKTGSKSFDLSDVYYGLNLQMLIYLFSIWENNPQILPAGVLYMPAKSPMVTVSRDVPEKELQKEGQKQLCMNGLLLDDIDAISGMERDVAGVFIPAKLKKDGSLDARSSIASLAEMGRLKRYIEKLLVDMAEKLQSGDIRANPAMKGNWTACDYCDYQSICRHEEEDPFREISKMDREQVLELLKEGDEENGA